jgi:ABC-type sugar transport system permease subunit
MFDKKKSPYLFLCPFLTMFLVFWIWPIVQSMYWSLFRWDGLSLPVFIGPGNYLALFGETDFLVALHNTLLAAAVYICVMLLCALVLGFILNAELLAARGFFRASFFIPVTVSLPVVALIFFIIYAPNNGILNKIPRLLGAVEPVDWLGDPRFALWAITALRVWRAAGYYSIFVIAGLQAIPRETIEAARTDGANWLQTVRMVILPQLKPIVIYIVIASSIWAFQLFEEPWILTQGGPVNATATMGIHVYRSGFQYFNLGYASASAYVLAVVILAFAALQLRFSRER